MVGGSNGAGVKGVGAGEAEYREFLKGLREKQVEEPVIVENEGEKNK